MRRIGDANHPHSCACYDESDLVDEALRAVTSLNLKGALGLSLLSIFVLLRLFTSLPLVPFLLLPFSLFVGAALTVLFLYETVSRWSEFNQTLVLTLIFVPISTFIMLPTIVNGTPTNLRSGILPFNISAQFLFWIGISQLTFLLPASLLLWFYRD